MTMQSRYTSRLLMMLTLSIWSQVVTAQLIRPTTQEEITRRLQVPPDNFDDRQALLAVILDRHPVPDLIAPHLDGDWAAEAAIAYLAAGGSEAVVADGLRRDIKEGLPYPVRTLYLAIALLNSPEFGPLARQTLITGLLEDDFEITRFFSKIRGDQWRPFILDLLNQLPTHEPDEEEESPRLEFLSTTMGNELFPQIRQLLDARQSWLRQLAAHWLICGDFDDLPMEQVRELLDHAEPYHSLAGATLTLRNQPENSQARDVLLQALASDDSEFRTLAIISAGTLADQDPEWFGRLLTMLLNADKNSAQKLMRVISRILPRHELLLAQFLQENFDRLGTPLNKNATYLIKSEQEDQEVLQIWEMILKKPQFDEIEKAVLRQRRTKKPHPDTFEILFRHLSSTDPDESGGAAYLLGDLELTSPQKSQLLTKADDLLKVSADPSDTPLIVNEAVALMYWKHNLERPRILKLQRRLLTSTQKELFENGLSLTRFTRSASAEECQAIFERACSSPIELGRIATFLSEIGSEFTEFLLGRLQDENPDRRAAAARLLPITQPSQAILDGLIALLNDQHVVEVNCLFGDWKGPLSEFAASRLSVFVYLHPELTPHLTSRPEVLAKLRPLLDEREWERVTSPRPTFEEIKSGDRIPTYRELEIVLKQDRPDNPFKRKYQPLELSPALLKDFLSKSRRLRASGGDFSNDGAMEIVNAVGESPNPPPELLDEMNLWLAECPVLEYDAAVSVAGNLLRHQPDNPAARKVILLDQRRYSPSFIR